jgi:hypothetical protein
VTALWFLVLVLAATGALLLVRAMRDVRDEVERTVDSFAEFQAALAPALVVLRDESRNLALHADDRRQGSASIRH